MIKKLYEDALAIIPARKNSKGIKFKNKKNLLGKPLISYTIEAAIQSGVVDILVATDDDEILSIAKSYGLETDYVRPQSVSNDESSMDSLILDVLKFIRKDKTYVYGITLQPTSPFRTAVDIKKAIELKRTHHNRNVIGVSKMLHHPYECIEEIGANDFELDWKFLAKPREKKSRRQDYEQNYWFINGAIYCFGIDEFLSTGGFSWKNSILYKMDTVNSIDIDTNFEFSIAESLMRKSYHNE
jgi:CMP-N,N'-diacetyllegionaminic acid synthase